MRDARILDYISSTAWAMEAGVFGRLVQVVCRHATGEKLVQEEIDAVVAGRSDQGRTPSGYVNRNGVGVVPITGVIARHARQVNGSSQPRGTSLEQLRGDLQLAQKDADAHSIMLAIDSPGGSVEGIVAAGEELRAMRGKGKPIAAHIDGLGASAAYWLAAQADQIYATRTSRVGSIGVLAGIVDDHRAFEQDGVDVNWVTSAPAKIAVAPGKKHSPADLEGVEREVAHWHDLFIEAVAAGRNLDLTRAAALGDGRIHFAPQAKDLGLIDGVSSEEDVLRMLSQTKQNTAASRTTAGVPQTETEKNMSKQDGAGAAPASAPPAAAAPTPTVASAPVNAPVADAESIARAARDAERQRIVAIQQLGEGVDASLVQGAINDGVSVGDAAQRFCAWHKQHRVGALAAMRADMAAGSRAVGTDDPDTIVAGAGAAAKGAKPAESKLTGEAKWRADFAAQASLQAEFGDVETYVAFKKFDGRPAEAFVPQRKRFAREED